MEISNVKNNCILIGLPQSGKSTFIAALWHVVESKEIDDSIKITSLPNDREYLNELRESWHECKAIERNKTEDKFQISLYISRNDIEYDELLFPDVSGEMYESQFESRKLENEYISMIESARSIIFFINPDFLKKPVLISEADFIPINSSNSSTKAKLKQWEYEDTPTQVILVDLLQMISIYLHKRIKLAVILSAWDVIHNSIDKKLNKMKPADWVTNNLPLFHQYLISNKSQFDFSFFGVSAQGAKYYGDNLILHKHEKPSDRIIVQKDDEITKDISLPIKWILND